MLILCLIGLVYNIVGETWFVILIVFRIDKGQHDGKKIIGSFLF